MTTNYPAALDSYSVKVDGVDTVLAAHVNNLQDAVVATETTLGVSAWTTWTPTITQSGAVAATVTKARYKIVNKICHVEVLLAVTAAGTGNNPIYIAGQPAAMQSVWIGYWAVLGTGMIQDAGTAYYVGAVLAVAATQWAFMRDGASAGYIGQDPNFALANTDAIAINATYEVA
jgi:hypothetical protein